MIQIENTLLIDDVQSELVNVDFGPIAESTPQRKS